MTAEFHKANRQRLYAEMKDGSAAVFFSGSAPRQSADAYYTFFTNRNFLYLTGIKFAGFVLSATKIGGNVQESIYILPPDLMKERWTAADRKPMKLWRSPESRISASLRTLKTISTVF